MTYYKYSHHRIYDNIQITWLLELRLMENGRSIKVLNLINIYSFERNIPEL